MEKKAKQKPKNRNTKSNWESIIHGLVGGFLTRIGSDISLKVHEVVNEIKQRLIGMIFLWIGFIFLLVGIAIYINVTNNSEWIGWGVVGFFTLGAGYLLSKR